MNNHFVSNWVADIISSRPADNERRKGHINLLASADYALCNALQGLTVTFDNDDVLGHIDKFAGQIAGISRLQGSISQSLTCSVCGAEVFKHA